MKKIRRTRTVRRTTKAAAGPAAGRARRTTSRRTIQESVLEQQRGPVVSVAGKGAFSSRMDPSRPVVGVLGMTDPMQGTSHKTPRDIEVPPRPRRTRVRVVRKVVKRRRR